MMRSAIALFLSAAGLLAGGILYSKKVSSHQDFSYGLPRGARIFFLSRWHRFRRPRGIARLPDGGQPKTVYDELALFSYAPGDNSLVKHAVIATPPQRGTNIRNTKLTVDKGVLYIAYKCNNDIKQPDSQQCFLGFDLATNKLTKLGTPGEISRVAEFFKDYWPKHRDRLIPISRLRKTHLNQLDPKAWDWPGYTE